MLALQNNPVVLLKARDISLDFCKSAPRIVMEQLKTISTKCSAKGMARSRQWSAGTFRVNDVVLVNCAIPARSQAARRILHRGFTAGATEERRAAQGKELDQSSKPVVPASATPMVEVRLSRFPSDSVKGNQMMVEVAVAPLDVCIYLPLLWRLKGVFPPKEPTVPWKRPAPTPQSRRLRRRKRKDVTMFEKASGIRSPGDLWCCTTATNGAHVTVFSPFTERIWLRHQTQLPPSTSTVFRRGSPAQVSCSFANHLLTADETLQTFEGLTEISGLSTSLDEEAMKETRGIWLDNESTGRAATGEKVPMANWTGEEAEDGGLCWSCRHGGQESSRLDWLHSLGCNNLCGVPPYTGPPSGDREVSWCQVDPLPRMATCTPCAAVKKLSPRTPRAAREGFDEVLIPAGENDSEEEEIDCQADFTTPRSIPSITGEVHAPRPGVAKMIAKKPRSPERTIATLSLSAHPIRSGAKFTVL